MVCTSADQREDRFGWPPNNKLTVLVCDRLEPGPTRSSQGLPALAR